MIARKAKREAVGFMVSGYSGMATVSFTAELLVDPATVDPTEPFAYSARVDGGGGGYYVELRELWQRDRLIALNQQTFALLA